MSKGVKMLRCGYFGTVYLATNIDSTDEEKFALKRVYRFFI